MALRKAYYVTLFALLIASNSGCYVSDSKTNLHARIDDKSLLLWAHSQNESDGLHQCWYTNEVSELDFQDPAKVLEAMKNSWNVNDYRFPASKLKLAFQTSSHAPKTPGLFDFIFAAVKSIPAVFQLFANPGPSVVDALSSGGGALARLPIVQTFQRSREAARARGQSTQNDRARAGVEREESRTQGGSVGPESKEDEIAGEDLLLIKSKVEELARATTSGELCPQALALFPSQAQTNTLTSTSTDTSILATDGLTTQSVGGRTPQVISDAPPSFECKKRGLKPNNGSSDQIELYDSAPRVGSQWKTEYFPTGSQRCEMVCVDVQDIQNLDAQFPRIKIKIDGNEQARFVKRTLLRNSDCDGKMISE